VSGRVTKSPRYTGLRYEHGKANRQFWRWLHDAADKAVWEWINRPRIGDVKPSTTPAVFRPRDHFRSDGQVKKRLTRAKAQEYCNEHEDCQAYRCTVCEAWHVGHKQRSAA
jgi:hypothetical protein